MTGSLFVGTSGFAYKEWKGPFYPEKTPDKEMLTHYAQRLPSVEINYTFRRLPSESTFAVWKAQAGEGFRFTLKASQRITHFKRLKSVQEDVDEFLRRARLLESKLGVILFQTPPNLAFDPDVLQAFADGLPAPFLYAMETRHASFKSKEAQSILKKNGIAFCGAETQDEAVENIPITSNHVYLRLRKEEYTADELANWSKKLREVMDGGHDVYCYFKHEGGGVGPEYALSVKEQVG